MKHKLLKCAAAGLMTVCLLLAGGCTRTSYQVGGKPLLEIDLSEEQSLGVLAENLMVMLNSEDPTHVQTLSAGAEISFDKEWQQWRDLQETYGQYQSYNLYAAFKYGDEKVTQLRASLEQADICLNAKWNARGKLMEIDMYLSPEDVEKSLKLPEGVVETEVVVDAGTGYPLNGKITMPANADNVPAVVLVQGNGAGDMDFTGGNTKVYRDLAWYLAEHGIASIRYDKRIRTYDNWSNNPTREELTVGWELMEDAAAASKLIKETDGVDASSVYMVAHSLGGLVSQRIDQEGGDFKGFILLAVPSRPWQEAVFDQYLNYGLANLDDDNLYTMASYMDSERKDINTKLDTYSDAELLGEHLLGMPACYWKDLNSVDNVQAIIDTDKPLLLLQGEADYQIVPEVDFAGWQEKLKDKQNATLISYEGLNHLFVPSEGCYKGSAKEYDIPHQMSEKVMEDIAAFIR